MYVCMYIYIYIYISIYIMPPSASRRAGRGLRGGSSAARRASLYIYIYIYIVFFVYVYISLSLYIYIYIYIYMCICHNMLHYIISYNICVCNMNQHNIV